MIARKGAFVVVADGGGATIYKISTRVGGVKLDDMQVVENDLPSRSADMGRDRPARTHTADGRLSAIEAADLHDAAEDDFATEIAGRVNTLAGKVKRGIIIFAPPRFLGEMRRHFSDAAKSVIVCEAPKDLRKLSVADLEKAVDRLDG
jgi:protein required for attachment to host cells